MSVHFRVLPQICPLHDDTSKCVAFMLVDGNNDNLSDQVFEDGSTFRGTLKTAACLIVATKYDLENAEFDEDRFSNQQGWWDYLESTARELINKCTFLHQGEDDDIGYQNFFTTGTKLHT